MKGDTLSFSEQSLEYKLSQISAKVVRATEISLSAKRLCDASNTLLMDAQIEIADLYESLSDILQSSNGDDTLY